MSGCPGRLSRRHFLHALGGAAAGLLAAGCKRQLPLFTAQTNRSGNARARVAIAHAAGYDRKVITERVRDLLDGIGGLGDIIKSGDRVAIKTNLTGGVNVKPLPGRSPIESYITHPEVVRALAAFARDAGAREVYIVEAAYEWESFTQWGYEAIAREVDATLIDLNDTAPYTDFAVVPVPEGRFVYKDLALNHLLQEIDALISVSKLKCHYSCGVTHTMKNLIGLAPCQFYRLNQEDRYRSAFHGTDKQMATRLPGVILDLNRARPIHLGVIDGIKTTEGGEGPWIQSMAAVQANVLLAGKDVVATDAVATAVMGFDPTAEMPDPPFLRAKNHLNMAYQLGLGTNRLEEIEVVGAAIADVQTRFKPCWD